MDRFEGRIAVVTGGGTGMGHELCRQLAAEGCHVATCDVDADALAATKARCDDESPDGTRVSTYVADVSDEDQVVAFRDATVEAHQTDHVHLLFNNAGIAGGGSFVADSRDEWERTFGVCWGGVYNNTRAFLPLLVAADEGHVVNTSSVNGLWASLGPGTPHTAYSAAKFAVRGFTEALIADFRINAPHLSASVVMPGHIGTSIVANTGKALGRDPQLTEMMSTFFLERAPMTAAEAATVILDGVRTGQWRILVGDDAHALDRHLRATPEEAYDPPFYERLRAEGVFDMMGGS